MLLWGVSAIPMPSLWPREHGASLQLAFPVVSACVLAQGAPASVALGLAAGFAFVAHEPLLLLSGGRGARKAEVSRRPALVRLALLLALAGLAALVALWLGAPGAWPLLAPPALLGAVAVGSALRGRERNVFAELLVAVALSSLALPVAVFGGAPLVASASLAAVWVVGFAVATVAARALVVQKRDAGRGLRVALVVASLTSVALAGAALAQVAPWRVAVAPLPLVVVALLLAAFPPPPQRMTAVGLGMAGACLVTLALALSALVPGP